MRLCCLCGPYAEGTLIGSNVFDQPCGWRELTISGYHQRERCLRCPPSRQRCRLHPRTPGLQSCPLFGKPRFHVWGRDPRRSPIRCRNNSVRGDEKNKRASAYSKKVSPSCLRCSRYWFDVVPLLLQGSSGPPLLRLIIIANDASGRAASSRSKERIVVGSYCCCEQRGGREGTRNGR